MLRFFLGFLAFTSGASAAIRIVALLNMLARVGFSNVLYASGGAEFGAILSSLMLCGVFAFGCAVLGLLEVISKNSKAVIVSEYAEPSLDYVRALGR